MTKRLYEIFISVADLNNGQSMALTSDLLSLISPLGLQESAWSSVHLITNDMATIGCCIKTAALALQKERQEF